MEWNDIVFLFTLLSCLNLAETYKHLETAYQKKIYGTCVGVFVIILILGPHIIHPLISTIVNSFIILKLDRRWIHIYSLVVSWSHLMLLHLSIIKVPWQAIAVQMVITLRLVGLSFESNVSCLRRYQIKLKDEDKPKILDSLEESEVLTRHPTLEDIFHYTYCFVGIHRGPYYSWKTFNDYFNLPFALAGGCKFSPPNKMRWFPVCFGIFFTLKYFIPSYYFDILKQYTFISNLIGDWYQQNVPQVFILLLYHHMISTLSEAICIESGFIVYPESCHAMPGIGPTANFKLLKNIEKNPNLAFKENYNFGAIKNTDDYQMLFGHTMRKTLRGCNMTIQYWFWSCIYRRLPIENKIIRTSITMLCWCIWCGMKAGNFIMILTLLLFIYVEDCCHDIIKKYSIRDDHPVLLGVFFMLRSLCLLYVAPTQLFSDSKKIIKFYNSLYWSMHLILLSILAVINYVKYKDTKDLCKQSIEKLRRYIAGWHKLNEVSAKKKGT